MKLNGTPQLLVYAVDVNILGESLHTIQKNTETLVVVSNETGLEENGDKTKYMVMSREQNAGRNHNIKIDNIFYEMKEEFKYLGTILATKNSIQEEIKSKLESGNVSYHSVHNLLTSSLLSKNIEVKKYRTIILPVVLYGCKTWSNTLREKLRLRVFENRVWRRIFGPKKDEVRGEWRKQHKEEPNIVRVIK